MRSGLRFPAERRSLYSIFPFRRKTGALRAYLVVSVLVGVRGVRVVRRGLWTLRPPRIPAQWRRVPVVVVGSGVLRRLNDLHRPIGISRACAQALRSPTLAPNNPLVCFALVRPAMKLRRGRNAAYWSRFGSLRSWLRCA